MGAGWGPGGSPRSLTRSMFSRGAIAGCDYLDRNEKFCPRRGERRTGQGRTGQGSREREPQDSREDSLSHLGNLEEEEEEAEDEAGGRKPEMTRGHARKGNERS